MNNQLRCQCGVVQGNISIQHSYGRAVCYCKDCQTFARFLGKQDEVLDGNNGTEILAVLPAAVHFTAGVDRLACMSLSDKGLLRWYASCCFTPIGNTPRDQKMAYVGLIRACLPTLDESVGPRKIFLNTESATGEVKASPLATFFGVLRIMKSVIGARLSGKYKNNPFFTADSGEPRSAPHVLPREDRKVLDDEA